MSDTVMQMTVERLKRESPVAKPFTTAMLPNLLLCFFLNALSIKTVAD